MDGQSFDKFRTTKIFKVLLIATNFTHATVVNRILTTKIYFSIMIFSLQRNINRALVALISVNLCACAQLLPERVCKEIKGPGNASVRICEQGSFVSSAIILSCDIEKTEAIGLAADLKEHTVFTVNSSEQCVGGNCSDSAFNQISNLFRDEPKQDLKLTDDRRFLRAMARQALDEFPRIRTRRAQRAYCRLTARMPRPETRL